MAEAYGNQVGRWRCKVSAWVASETADAAVVTVRCLWCSVGWGFQVHYCSAYASCDGQSGGTQGTFYAYSGYGQSVETVAYEQSFTVPKSSAARRVACGASFTMPDYQAGSSYASCEVEVPGRAVLPPEGPSYVTAVHQGNGLFYVQWTNNPTADAPYESVAVEVMEDEGAWGAPAEGSRTFSPPVDNTTWAHGRDNRRYRFRVRAENAAGSATVDSPYVYTRPDAPLNLSAAFSGGRVVLTWDNAAPWATVANVDVSADGQHWSNAADLDMPASSWVDDDPPVGSAWYRVNYRIDGGPESGYATVGPVSTYTSEDYPTVEILSPDGPVHDLPVQAAWGVGGPDPVASQDVALIADGQLVEHASVGALVRPHFFDGSGLVDGHEASLIVSVTDTKGLSTTAIEQFSVDFWPPASPSAVVGVDHEAKASIVTVAAGSGASRAATSAIDVYRVNPDGTEELVAEGLADGSSCRDDVPPLNVAFKYRIVARAANGKDADSLIGSCVPSRWWVLNTPDAALRVALDAEVSESVELSGESFHFADGDLPTWYEGPDLDATWSFSWTVKRCDLEKFRRASRSSGLLWVRLHDGRRAHGHPKWSIQMGKGGRYSTVTLDLTEAR